MITLNGGAVARGAATGKAYIYKNARKVNISDARVSDREQELKRYNDAVERVRELKTKQYEDAVKSAFANINDLADSADTEMTRIDNPSADIFLAQTILLDDKGLNDACVTLISDDAHTAEYAVSTAYQNAARRLRDTGDAVISARADDLRDLMELLLDKLDGGDVNTDIQEPLENSIVFAKNLTPSELMRLMKYEPSGIALAEGEPYGHTVILAQGLDIPVVIGCGDELLKFVDSDCAIDGYDGGVYIEPNAETIRTLMDKNTKYMNNTNIHINVDIGADSNADITACETVSIPIYANINSPDEAGRALKRGAAGIGLYRTEFLYMESDHAPGEEYQLDAYSKVLSVMGDAPVIIRTFDIGADKLPSYIDDAYGSRGIHLSLHNTPLFKTQLRALLRAACLGELHVMLPMVTDIGDIRRTRTLIDECEDELRNEGQEYGSFRLGIMIETPAAVFMADELASEADFFSIGTNDLTQYICASDRGDISGAYDPRHPAVLRAIEMTVRAAHERGITVGICGELASATDMTRYFTDLGVDYLSVGIGSLPNFALTY